MVQTLFLAEIGSFVVACGQNHQDSLHLSLVLDQLCPSCDIRSHIPGWIINVLPQDQGLELAQGNHHSALLINHPEDLLQTTLLIQ